MITICFDSPGNRWIITAGRVEDTEPRFRGISADTINLSLHGAGKQDLAALAELLPSLAECLHAAPPIKRTQTFVGADATTQEQV